MSKNSNNSEELCPECKKGGPFVVSVNLKCKICGGPGRLANPEMWVDIKEEGLNTECEFHKYNCQRPKSECTKQCETYIDRRAMLKFYAEPACPSGCGRGCSCKQTEQDELDKAFREAQITHDVIQRSLIDTRN
jgi:hypothetical protein